MRSNSAAVQASIHRAKRAILVPDLSLLKSVCAARHIGQSCTIAIIALLLAPGLLAQAQSAKPANPDTQTNCRDASGNSLQSPSAESQAKNNNSKTKTAGTSSATSEDNCGSRKVPGANQKQTNRILWVLPNFAAVSANTQMPPLTVKGKFWLATEDSFDYSSFVWTGIIAGQEFGLNDYPEFHQGTKGYARYYWHNFVDGVSGTFFTEAIVPALTHEDPRYYTLGHGGFFRRSAYALSRVVLTKTDSGGTSFNWSEVAGNALEAGLSNAYYPPQELGLRQTGIYWGAQLESAALNNIVKEFWPDIRRFLFRPK